MMVGRKRKYLSVFLMSPTKIDCKDRAEAIDANIGSWENELNTRKVRLAECFFCEAHFYRRYRLNWHNWLYKKKSGYYKKY